MKMKARTVYILAWGGFWGLLAHWTYSGQGGNCPGMDCGFTGWRLAFSIVVLVILLWAPFVWRDWKKHGGREGIRKQNKRKD